VSSLFDTTIPFGEPELMRASAFRQYLTELDTEAAESGAGTRLSSLSPSLLADLTRFERHKESIDVLEVVGAALRHAKRLTVHLQFNERVIPLTVFPNERLVHCPVNLCDWSASALQPLRVMHVEPAILRPPGDGLAALVGEVHLHQPLVPLLWTLALQGARSELLTEIAGPAVYRVAPGLDLSAMPDIPVLHAAIRHLRGQATSLRELAEWPGLDRELAVRLLNALYLQSGLMISRSHPAGLGESWFGKAER
jgi:hypothetical protein